MKLIQALSGETRSGSLSIDDWIKYFQYQGVNGMLGPRGTLGEKQEEPDSTFEGYVQGIYKQNGVVFACMLARLLLFSEARFQFRRRVLGRPGELFGMPSLAPLEEPWPGGTTGNLLTRAMQDADLGGNFYAAERRFKAGHSFQTRIMRMRPDWVTIILGSTSDPEVGFGDLDAEVLGYVYKPGGNASSKEPVSFLRDEVAHFAPIPDPLATYRGMSWLTPVIREIMGDQAATSHKLKFFEQGATPNLVVTLDASIQREAFEKWLELFEAKFEGSASAYKTMYLGAGAKVEAVGSDLKNVDFKAVQGAGETRIAAAAGVPPVIVGLSEGLQAATYSNYGQARRRFADGTMRPLWREIAGAMETLVPAPANCELWYDDRDISFLQEDRKDEAEIQQCEAVTIKTLIEAGYDPASVVVAVNSNDMTRLEHTGLVSVQLQQPGAGKPPALPAG